MTRLPSDYSDCVLRARPPAILTPDGVVSVERIGKGVFATVYREIGGQQRVFSLVAEGVHDKEILATTYADDPSNPHLPRVTRYGTLTDGRSIYEMPFYGVPFRSTNANASARAAFSVLRRCIHRDAGGGSDERGYEVATRKMECIEKAAAQLPPRLVEAIRALHDNSTNYGDQYDLEISPRNVATDAQGNLVLLDVLFDRDKAWERTQHRRPGRRAVVLPMGLGLGMGMWGR